MAINRLPVSKARERFADILDEVSVKGERILLDRHGKAVAAVISPDDLELLVALEDRYDVETARRALAESDERVAWTSIKERLSL
jgi:prevent-host-death family protein